MNILEKNKKVFLLQTKTKIHELLSQAGVGTIQ
jgi:hypothetical protein